MASPSTLYRRQARFIAQIFDGVQEAVYASPPLYRAATWLGSRLRWLIPSRQGPWTSVRTPLKRSI